MVFRPPVLIVVLVFASCGPSAASVPSATPLTILSATPTIIATTAVACADAVAPIPQPPLFTDRPGVQLPGKALFVDDRGVLRTYEAGRIQVLQTPYPVRDTFARLAPDGHAVALLGGPGPVDANLWTEGYGGTSTTLVSVPASYASQDSEVLWSPGVRRAMYSSSFNASEIFVVGTAGEIYRASLGADLMHVGFWRSDDELTLMTAKPQTNFPLSDVTLWSWRPPLDPIRMDGPITLSAYPTWSPDGRTLATVEEGPQGRAVHLRGPVDRTLLAESDVATGPKGCVRGTVRLSGVSWSPDSQTLALLAVGTYYYVIFTNTSGRTPNVFATPAGAANCFIPGRIAWSRGQALVPLFGPACGLGGNDLPNAIALVDPATAKVMSYVPITRKGFVGSSGRWAAMSGTENRKVTTFFSLDDPTIRTTVQLSPVIDYCCAP